LAYSRVKLQYRQLPMHLLVHRQVTMYNGAFFEAIKLTSKFR
jgi:hypothetical protein